MASTRAVADSGRTGLDIKIKRTNLDYTNQIFNPNSAIENKETLKYGELLYFDSDNTLVIGDSAGTAIRNLPILKFKSRDEVASQTNTTYTEESFETSITIYPKNTVVYFTSDGIAIISDGENIPRNQKIVKLFNKNKVNLISYFDSKDSSGITRLNDEQGDTLYVKELTWPIIDVATTNTYFQINTSNLSEVNTIQSDSSKPGCYKIFVDNMKTEYTPCGSLYIPADDLNDSTLIKNKKIAYSRISSIQTFNNFIIICFLKRPTTNFQLCFVGG